MRYLFVLLLCGCSTTERYWDRPGATEETLYMESGQCKEKALSISLVNAQQANLVYYTCMQGRGWKLMER